MPRFGNNVIKISMWGWGGSSLTRSASAMASHVLNTDQHHPNETFPAHLTRQMAASRIAAGKVNQYSNSTPSHNSVQNHKVNLVTLSIMIDGKCRLVLLDLFSPPAPRCPV